MSQDSSNTILSAKPHDRALQIQKHLHQQQPPSVVSSPSGSSNFPFAQNGGYNKDGRATATCYCGAVQLEFPTDQSNGLVDTFICNCTDCRKITASMFASNFIVTDESLVHLRGEDKLMEFKQSDTIATGNSMSNHFCSICGSLMYRRSSGFRGKSIMRIGTIDDFNLQETKLKPRIEQFGKDRVGWFAGGQGVKQDPGNYYDSSHPRFSASEKGK